MLTETLLDVMHDDLRARFVFNAGHVTLGLLGSIAGALALTGLLIFRSLVEAARVPTIRLASTRLEPDLDLDERHTWHLFLSHIWGTGQDQCATIKRQLCLLMPDVSIFLDVDDLESIDLLEEYIDSSAVVAIFVSKGYVRCGLRMPHSLHDSLHPRV